MRIPKEEIVHLLHFGDQDFCPHLSKIVDIETYAEKLSKYAEFMIIGTYGNILGWMAYYKNTQGKFLYITHFWVNRLCQSKGYGSYLINKLIHEEGQGYDEVCVEIYKEDDVALNFYGKNHFILKEDRIDRVLLSRTIHKEE